MATAYFTTAAPMSTTTHVRQYITDVSAAFDAVGLARTADTGQIVPSGITYTTGNQNYGYEVRAFSDSVGNPVVFKVLYRQVAGGGDHPFIELLIGQGSNGSGTITGPDPVSTAMAFGGQTPSTNPATGFISSDGGYLTLAWYLKNPIAWWVSVGRTRDDLGAATSAGLNILFGGAFTGTSAGNQCQQIFSPKTGLRYSLSANKVHSGAPPSGTGLYASNYGVYPVAVSVGAFGNPCLSAVATFASDQSGGTVIGSLITYPLYNATQYALYVGTLPGSALNGNGNVGGIALRVS